MARKQREKKTMTACMRKVGIPSIPNRVEGYELEEKVVGPGKYLESFFFKTDARPVLPICHKFCPRDFPTSTIFADEKQLEALRFGNPGQDFTSERRISSLICLSCSLASQISSGLVLF